MAEITDQQIADAAAQPQSMSVDGVNVAQRSLKELMDAQDNLSQKNAEKPRRGLLFSKLIPGSARGQ
jgi:hypothetical protein